MVADGDQTIPPDAERQFAGRMGATTVEIATNHVAMVSHPDDMLQLIETVAEAVPGRELSAWAGGHEIAEPGHGHRATRPGLPLRRTWPTAWAALADGRMDTRLSSIRSDRMLAGLTVLLVVPSRRLRSILRALSVVLGPERFADLADRAGVRFRAAS